MRRSTYRALADLRAEFQRTMSEPPSISRRATAWWPAVIALEQVMDAITATALAVSRGAQVPPSGVRQLCDALQAATTAARRRWMPDADERVHAVRAVRAATVRLARPGLSSGRD